MRSPFWQLESFPRESAVVFSEVGVNSLLRLKKSKELSARVLFRRKKERATQRGGGVAALPSEGSSGLLSFSYAPSSLPLSLCFSLQNKFSELFLFLVVSEANWQACPPAAVAGLAPGPPQHALRPFLQLLTPLPPTIILVSVEFLHSQDPGLL